MFQHETLRDLAAAIATGETGQPGGLLVSIQPLGHKTPVFFIPGIGGEVLALHDLVANLGEERPIYGLQGADFGDSGRNFKTIEQAAAEYANAVRAAQPQGPYNLAGYSFGGHLALEIARCLATTSEAEPRVLLIDTYPPVPRRNTSLVNRVRIHYTNLRQLKNAPEIAFYIRGRLQRVYLRLIRQGSTRVFARQLKEPDSSPAATASFALAAYTPRAYPGKVVLFKASQREWYENWDPMGAWQEFISGELEFRTVPGGHYDLIKNPHAFELARQLKEALA
jgi:thioesterase domain-containing protein